MRHIIQHIRQKTPVLRTKYLVLCIGFLILFGLSALAAYMYGTYSKVTVRSWGRSPSPVPTSSPIPDTFNQGRQHVSLLLGYGGGGHQGGLLTDTMMVVVIDPPSKTITLLSLPRDVWVQLPLEEGRSSGWKINAAYAIGSDDAGYRYKPIEFTGPAGGGELAKYAVKQVTGLTVDRFVSVSFRGFTQSIDVLNGVEVEVEKAFVDPLYPIEGKEEDPCGMSPEQLATTATLSATEAEKAFPCRYEELTFVKGTVLMDGATALKYVRSRHSAQDGSDFGRAARQRNLLIAVRNKIFRLDFFPKIIPFVNTLSDDVRTDFSLTDMQEFLRYKDELAEYEIVSTALTNENVLAYGRSPDGQSILRPKSGLDQWPEVHQWVQDELLRLRMDDASASASPSGSVATSSAVAP